MSDVTREPIGALLASACLSVSPPASPRYFTPTGSGAVARVATEGPALRLLLRLRHVRAAGHLKERIVWRHSDVEFGFHELRRWTQPPHRFVEQGRPALTERLAPPLPLPSAQTVYRLQNELVRRSRGFPAGPQR